MRSILAALLWLGLVAAGLALLVWPQLPVPPVVIGAGLLILGLMAGLRAGAEASRRLLQDVIHMNRLLSEQSRDLAELNQSYLKEIAADSRTTGDSVQPEPNGLQAQNQA
jgi:hypothetical protein